MATILESLKSVNAYPIPLRSLVETAEGRGLTLSDEATKEVMTSRAYRLAVADLLLWLAIAPDITQGGQSYSFTDEQRKLLRSRATAVYGEFDENVAGVGGVAYGYKGSRL